MGTRNPFNQVTRANQPSPGSSSHMSDAALDEAAMALEKSIFNLRQSVSRATANQDSLQNQYNRAQSEVLVWHQRAERAQQQGNKAAIQEALNHKHEQVKTASALKRQLDQQVATLTALKQTLNDLEREFLEIKPRSANSMLMTTESIQYPLEPIAAFNTKTAIMAIEQLEAKILQVEARSQEAAKLADAILTSLAAILNLSSSLDSELGVIKSQLLGAMPTTQTQIVVAAPIDPQSPQAMVDAELEGITKLLLD